MSLQQVLPRAPWYVRAHRMLDAILRGLSFYVIPLAIALVSLLALLFWNNQYTATGDKQLALKVWRQNGAAPTQAELAAHFAASGPVTEFNSGLHLAPLWFSLTTHASEQQATVVELPSRHAVEVTCWDMAGMRLLGSASRSGAQGAMEAVKAGFALHLQHSPATVLCRASFAGPARLSAVEWAPDQMALSVLQYHRKSGLLDGGMIVLTLFVLTTALINRQLLYVLFAGWLIINLRVGALSAGWDLQWLGQVVPAAWLLPSRAITIALYAISCLTLFRVLFAADLAKTRFQWPLRIAQWFCLPLLAASIMLPYNVYLPLMWGVVAVGLLTMTVALVNVMVSSNTPVAFWFAASFAATFISSLYEVSAAALGLRAYIGVINSVTGALASSLLAALAVAEQMRLETEQRIAAQAELAHAYEAMPVGLFTLDVEGRFLSSNPALCKMLGSADIMPGRTHWKQFFSDAVWARLHALVHAHADAEMAIAHRDASRRFLVRATLARGKIEGVLQDTTEQDKATEQLHFMANNDPLTKVFNRRGIEHTFDDALGPLAAGRPLALAYLDLDRFKLINDLFGHNAGDEVLKQVCQRIASVLVGGQQIGRVGGDEFVIVMPDTTIGRASLICRGIVERVGNTPYRVADKAFHVRCSIGLIEVAPGMQMKDAVSAADRASREAKGGRSGALVVYERNAAAFVEREAELSLVARLSGHDATAGMFLEMQPIMSLKAPRDSLNLEVLLRMRDSDGGVMQAGPIIAAAEKSGRAGVIDRWVLASTLAWIDKHAARLENTQFVCMNLSGASLNDERFVQDTIEILRRHVHVANRLCMEVTESVALHDLDNTRRFIDQVRSFGVKVALDDFGAGYTSFSYLKELPADVLKIDGSFIVNINAHPANVAIVEAIVSLASNLGMKTIAEWAEDAATVRTLADIGVDYVQGWAVARAMSPDLLLDADSSASFIVDEALLQLVRLLDAGSGAADLFTRVPGRAHDLH